MNVRDRGSMSVYAAVLAPSLFICVILFTNAVVRWDAWREANDVAAAAARAAAQPTPQEFDGHRLMLGPAAESRAISVVTASGHSGQVSISGDEVTVTVTVSVDYIFGNGPFGDAVSGSANARVAVSEEG